MELINVILMTIIWLIRGGVYVGGEGVQIL